MRLKAYIYIFTILFLLVQGRISADPDVRHVVVYHNEEHFAGWPANQGIWSWGNEILVGFNIGKYKHRTGGGKHSVEGKVRVAFARSLDGGETWTLDEEAARDVARTSLLDGGDAWDIQRSLPGTPEIYNDIEKKAAHPKLNLQDENFIMKFRNDYYFYSEDRGHNWNGPFALGKMPVNKTYARTNYVVTSPDSALVFLSSLQSKDRKERGRSFVAETKDGGQSYQFLSFIGEDLGKGQSLDVSPVSSIMPGVVKLSDKHFVVALRQRIGKAKWSDIYESRDGGKNWQKLSELERGSHNPVSLVVLGEEKIAAIYGWRGRNFGLRAKISKDGGKTWSREIILRKDAISWDIGYTRAVVRPDGAVVVVYYYTTKERPQPHIEATIWKP